MQEIRNPKLGLLATFKGSGSLAIIFKAAIVAIAASTLYFQDLSMIFRNALQDEGTSHVLAIPILFGYLIYRKRKMLRAVIPLETASQPRQARYLPMISGVLLSAISMMLYWYGSYTFTPLEYHVLTLPIFVAGLTLIMFNVQTIRQLAFPIIFLAFLTPPPSEFLYSFGSTLSVISSEASNAIVRALGIPSAISNEYGNPTIIITRPDQTTVGFTVDIACSGIYSLVGFLIFAAFVAYVVRDKPWKKAATFMLGFPLIYFFNIIRITTILLIGYQYGEQLALELFHLMGGWLLIFLGTLLLLAVSEKVFKAKMFTTPRQSATCTKCNPVASNPKEDFCSNCGRLLKHTQKKLQNIDIAKVAIIAAAVMLLLWIQAPIFAFAQGASQITIQTPTGEQGNTQLLPQIPGYTLQFTYRDQEFEQKTKQDASLIYAYDKTDELTVWVGIEIASATSMLHHWEACYIISPQSHGYQPGVVQLDLRDVQILQNPPIIARYFAFEHIRSNQTQVILYWYETSTFKINNASQPRQVKISLITYPDQPEDVAACEEQLLRFATTIANHWQPIKTWTLAALIISRNGLSLATGMATLLIVIVILQAHGSRRERNKNAFAYHKMSLSGKRLIDAVHQAEKTTTPTLTSVDLAYRNTMDENVEKERTLERLLEAEKIGLVSRKITNLNDEPFQVWNTNLNQRTPFRQTLNKIAALFVKIPKT